MAFTAAQKTTLVKILGVTPSILDNQITLLSTSLTSDIQTAIEAEITLWTTAGTNFTNIEPNVKNFGARISTSDARASIRKNIAVLLERPEWGKSGSRLQRS